MFSRNEKGISSIWLIVVAAVLVVGGVGYYIYQSNSNDNVASNQETVTEQQEMSSEEQNTNDETNEIAEATGTVITTGDSEFGEILFDDEGQAIYIWEVEETDVAECYDDCADAWPPVLTDGAPIAAGNVNGDLLGTTERTDGTMQVTYNGHPLYYYAHEGPGEVKCHNVSTHGGLWWVIQPDGNRAD